MTLPGSIALLLSAFITLPALALTLLVYLADVLWAIPAAIISKRVATENDLDAGFYAKKGFLYAMLSFVLWRYFIRQMRGEPIDENGVRVSYIVMFIGWLGASVGGSFVLALLLVTEGGGISDTSNFLSVVWVLVNAALWFRTLRGLMAHHKASKESLNETGEGNAVSNTQDKAEDILIKREYLRPVLYSKLSLLCTLGLAAWMIVSTYIAHLD